MKEGQENGLFALGAGPLAALLLGMALVPLRGLTTASNLSFAFMALTIVTAEFGGRAAAIATALTSALSLDFFLTEPYLKLSIEDNHDMIAFVGLAVCGLIAAGLGSHRSQRITALAAIRKHRDLLGLMLQEWDEGAAVAPQLERILSALVGALPVAGAALRDPAAQVLASAGAADERRIPAQVLEPGTLLPIPGAPRRAWRLGLPEGGARIPLTAGGRGVGWLDVRGSGSPLGPEGRRALADVVRLLGLLLANPTAGRTPPEATNDAATGGNEGS